MNEIALADLADELAWWEAKAAVDPARAAWDDAWPEAQATAHHLSHLVGHLRGATQIMEIGCGPARLLVPLSRLLERARIVGIDPSPSMVRAARARIAAVGTSTAWVMQCNGRDIPMDHLIEIDAPIDGAYSVLAFQHMPHAVQQGYLRQLVSRLAASSPIVIQFASGLDCVPGSYQVTFDALATWCLQAGLVDVRIERDTIYPTHLWLYAATPRAEG